MSDPVEIIDLTSPRSPLVEIPDSEAEPRAASPQNTSNMETGKKKRRRSKKSSVNAGSTKATPESRSTSEERNPELDVKRKRKKSSMEGHTENPTRHGRKDDEKPENVGSQDIFFVDLAPAPIPSLRPTTAQVPNTSNGSEASGKLLVPAHVTVLGSTPVEIIHPLTEDEEDEDFIKYLDYEDSKHILRYYDDIPSESAVLNRTVCKNCGAEGEHKTSACPVQICLTCGVRNEHSTRSCPISKVCFTCGMKGHINANCPNRRSARALLSSQEMECDRCSSSHHKTNECPTMWRLYEYFSGEEQIHILAQRESKKYMKLGEGGEGYVADDEWCYNCGNCGHWGDDCHDIEKTRFPDDHSAFSIYNIMTGPFFDPAKEPKTSTSRSRVRDRENMEDISGWGKGAPDRVGRQARMKSRAALEKQAHQVEDDPDDWFGNPLNRTGSSNRRPPKDSSKSFSFGPSVSGGRQYASPSDSGPPSLLMRLGGYQHGDQDSRDSRSSRSRGSQRSHKRDYPDNPPTGSRDSRRRREDRSSNHYSDRPRNDSGPRYKGGYVAR
ncbi:hypothetical protein BDZ97DRAFT_1775256 [Flammula alnicola]|nr:hypothetical protein BDZ97DRAFT_1775256 [Flammula alnicola]